MNSITLPSSRQQEAPIRFAEHWDDTAQRLLSCLYNEPSLARTDIALDPQLYPRAELHMIRCVLYGLAQTPLLFTLARALWVARDQDWPINPTGNLADLSWLETLELNGLRAMYCAAQLVEFHRRRVLAEAMVKAAENIIEVQANAEPVIAELAEQLAAWRAGITPTELLAEPKPQRVVILARRRKTNEHRLISA